MPSNALHLEIQPFQIGVFKLPPSSSVPEWVFECSFFSITRTYDELSIFCTDKAIPLEILAERNWACFKVMEHLDFTTTGILASLADPLAEAGISIFSISTFDSDYILVHKKKLDMASKVLEAAGHTIEGGESDLI